MPLTKRRKSRKKTRRKKGGLVTEWIQGGPTKHHGMYTHESSGQVYLDGNKGDSNYNTKFVNGFPDDLGSMRDGVMYTDTKEKYFAFLKKKPGNWRTGFHLNSAFDYNWLFDPDGDSDHKKIDGLTPLAYVKKYVEDKGKEGTAKEIEISTPQAMKERPEYKDWYRTYVWYKKFFPDMFKKANDYLTREVEEYKKTNERVKGQMIPIIRRFEKADGGWDVFDFKPMLNDFNGIPSLISGRFSGTVDENKEKYLDTSLYNRGKLVEKSVCARKLSGSNCEEYRKCKDKKCVRVGLKGKTKDTFFLKGMEEGPYFSTRALSDGHIGISHNSLEKWNFQDPSLTEGGRSKKKRRRRRKSTKKKRRKRRGTKKKRRR